MHQFRIGNLSYQVADDDYEVSLAHAVGRAFVEMQQLEFMVISHLDALASGTATKEKPFDVFASKTFGNLIREMQKHTLLNDLAETMRATKERRDFFVHKFLFHRYGGAHFTSASEYEVLIRDATEIGLQFAECRKKFVELMLSKAPIAMFAGKVDPDTGEITIVESEFSKNRSSH